MDEVFVSAWCQISFMTKLLPVIRGFQVNNINPFKAIKIQLNCHMIKSTDALYLLTLLTNTAIVEANSVDPDQQQSVLCLHCVTQRLLKHISRRSNDRRFKH